MSRRFEQLILAELTHVRADVRGLGTRLDSMNSRIDTVIDSLADLRRGFDQHTHDG